MFRAACSSIHKNRSPSALPQRLSVCHLRHSHRPQIDVDKKRFAFCLDVSPLSSDRMKPIESLLRFWRDVGSTFALLCLHQTTLPSRLTFRRGCPTPFFGSTSAKGPRRSMRNRIARRISTVFSCEIPLQLFGWMISFYYSTPLSRMLSLNPFLFHTIFIGWFGLYPN